MSSSSTFKDKQYHTVTCPKYHTVRQGPSIHSWLGSHPSLNSAFILFSPAHLRSFMTSSNTVVMQSCWQSLPTDRQRDRQIDQHCIIKMMIKEILTVKSLPKFDGSSFSILAIGSFLFPHFTVGLLALPKRDIYMVIILALIKLLF